MNPQTKNPTQAKAAWSGTIFVRFPRFKNRETWGTRLRDGRDGLIARGVARSATLLERFGDIWLGASIVVVGNSCS